MLDSSWTIGIPPTSGLWETICIYGNGEFDSSFRFPHHKATRVANWTITPEGAWHRVEYDIRTCEVLSLEPAMVPRQDNSTSGLYTLDSKLAAYRPVQA